MNVSDRGIVMKRETYDETYQNRCWAFFSNRRAVRSVRSRGTEYVITVRRCGRLRVTFPTFAESVIGNTFVFPFSQGGSLMTPTDVPVLRLRRVVFGYALPKTGPMCIHRFTMFNWTDVFCYFCRRRNNLKTPSRKRAARFPSEYSVLKTSSSPKSSVPVTSGH